MVAVGPVSSRYFPTPCQFSYLPPFQPYSFCKFLNGNTYSISTMCDVHIRVWVRVLCMSRTPINAGGETAKTIAPVQASPANDAEFCDSPGAFWRFGLKRSMLYELSARGLIKSVSLRKRGAIKGKRLWSCDSIRSYLREQMEVAK